MKHHRSLGFSFLIVMISLISMSELQAQQGPETVTFTTSDMVNISGSWYPAGSSAPAVLCLHQWRSDRQSYHSLAQALQKQGIAVLSIDLRGYGGSRKRSDGSAVQPDRQAGKDVEAAIRFLKENRKVPSTSIAIVGASYGSSNALMYAATDKAIAALVLLSPGLNYFNVLPIEAAYRTYQPRPVLAVVSSEDLRSVECVDALKAIRSTGLMVEVVDNAGHGTEMFTDRPQLLTTVVSYLMRQLHVK